MADENPPPPPPPHVQHVSVKPPPFAGASVRRWFTIVEAQFGIARITVDATKCMHVISNVPVDVLDQLQDNVVLNNIYDDLKNAIINLFVKSEPQIYNDLLNCNVLATKPTLYLQQLRSLASGWNLPDEFLKIQFINAMPPTIKPNLVAHQGTLDQIAQVADTLLAYNYNNNIKPNQYHPNSNISNINYHDNDYQIEPPHHSVNQLHNQSSKSYQRQTGYNRTNDRQNNYRRDNVSSNDYLSHNVKPFKPNQKQQVCRYHLYFGHSAKRCKNWCILNNPSIMTTPDSRPNSRFSSPNRSNAAEN